MSEHLVEAPPFRPDTSQLAARLHVGPDQQQELAEMIRQAEAVARPKGMYRQAYIDSAGPDVVVVEGIEFHSKLLVANIGGAHRLFPYVATCGRELMAWAEDFRTDPLQQYWADIIMETALRTAIQAINDDLTARYSPGKTAAMNPGSLPDWPLPEQARLFTLLGDVAGTVGVRLTDSFLMLPIKSVSGLRFPTETDYKNCQLCLREKCPGRQAPFDPQLYAQRLG